MTSTCLLTYQEKQSVLHTCLPMENELSAFVSMFNLLVMSHGIQMQMIGHNKKQKYTRGARNNVRGSQNATSSTHMNSTLEPYTSQICTVGKTSSGSCQLDTHIADNQHRFGGCTLEVANHTIDSTTQLAERCGEMPLYRRYKTKFKQLQ